MNPVAFSAALVVLALGAEQRGRSTAPPPTDQVAIEIVDADGAKRSVTFKVIQDAKTGSIVRYGQTFDVTPFTTVLGLAGLAPDARLHVVGEDDEMTLQRGSQDDPAAYGVIFNMRGLPVLTPMSARNDSGRGASGTPPRSGSLPPAGSGAGQGGGRATLPPPQTVPGSGGRGGGSGAGSPAGFTPLREVRSFTRIEVLR